MKRLYGSKMQYHECFVTIKRCSLIFPHMLRFWYSGAANNLVGVTCCIKELLLFRVDQWVNTPHTANRLLPSYYFCLFTETWMRGSHRKASVWVVKLWASWSISRPKTGRAGILVSSRFPRHRAWTALTVSSLCFSVELPGFMVVRMWCYWVSIPLRRMPD